MNSRRSTQAVRRVCAALVVAGSVTAMAGAVPAAAATATGLRYSTDGGTTWTTSVHLAPGETALVRHWFDNAGSATEAAASLTTTIPESFSIVPDTTRVCLDPVSNGPAAPASAETRCSTVLDDAALQAGQVLAVSPTAGLFGFSDGATSGPLAAGRTRFLNLHQCVTWNLNPAVKHTKALVLDDASQPPERTLSNVSNTAQSGDPSCDTAETLKPDMSGTKAFDLFANRYLNLGQCRWLGPDGRSNTSFIDTTPASEWHVASGTSDSAAGPGCAPVPGWTLSADASGSAAFDLLENRYLHLQSCYWAGQNGSHTVVVNGSASTDWASGSEASNSAVGPEATCTTLPPDGTWFLGYGKSQSFDLLDPARGAGFLTYEVAAPEQPTPERCAAGPIPASESFAQSASLASSPSGTQTASGTIVVDWSAGPEPCVTFPIPMVDRVVGLVTIALGGIGLEVARRRRIRRWPTH